MLRTCIAASLLSMTFAACTPQRQDARPESTQAASSPAEVEPAEASPQPAGPAEPTARHQSAINLDGRIDEPAWTPVHNAHGWFRLNDPQGRLTDHDPAMYLHRDAEALYVAVVCTRPALKPKDMYATSRDEEAWRDEGIELFFQPDRSREEYFHFVINAGGVVFDEINQAGPAGWSHPSVQAAADFAEDNRSFTVEVRLDFAGWLAPPSEGDRWGFNALRTITRDQGGSHDIATLSRLDSSAHEPARFSELLFSQATLRLDRRGLIEGRSTGPIVNPSFENDLAGWTVHTWADGRFGPGRFEATSREDCLDGLASVCLSGENTGVRGAIEPSRVGLKSQPLDLPAGLYLLCGYYRTDFTDTELEQTRPALADIYLYGPENIHFLLAPSPRWKRFRMPIEKRSDEPTSILLRLWTDGTICFDALELIQLAGGDGKPIQGGGLIEVNGRSYRIIHPPAEKLAITPTAPQTQAGLIPFARRDLWTYIHERTAPRKGDRIDRIDLQAAPDEFESALVGVYALEDLKSFRIRVEPIPGQAGKPIPADWLKLARIPYWLQRTGYAATEARPIAEVIRPVAGLTHQQDLQAGTNVWFYLTAHVPADAQAGVYHARVVLTGREGRELRLPMTLTVHPFQLVKPDQHIGLYVEYYQDMPAVFSFMKRYGLDIGVLFSECKLDHVDGRWQLDASALLPDIRDYIDAGMTPPLPVSVDRVGQHLTHRLGLVGAMQRDSAVDAGSAVNPATEAAYPQALRDAYAQVIRQFDADLRQAGLDKAIAYYPVDEPTSHPKRIPRARVEMQIIRQVVPEAVVWTTVHDDPNRFRQIAPLLDIACIGGLEISPAFRRIARDHDIDLWSYTGVAEDWSHRLDGWKMIAAGIDRRVHWLSHRAAANADEPLNDMADGFKQVAMFYPSSRGYLSTVQYESLREAIDDLRYLATAHRLLQRAEAGEVAADPETLTEARRKLRALRQRGTSDLSWEDCQALRREAVEIIRLLPPKS